MKFSNDILNELKQISPSLAGIEKVNVFTVAEDYFTLLPNNIIKTVLNNELFGALDNEKKMQVPEDYFENLSSQILRKIKGMEIENVSEELKTLSPLLYSIQNENVFSVPPRYFTNLPEEVISKVEPGAKIISITKRNSAWRMVAAAVVTGFIAVSSLWISQRSAQSSRVNDVAGIPTYSEVTSQYKSEKDINAGISKLSDDEIIKYLETTSNASDNDAITTNIEEKELPAPQDYLQDEKTLDNYLNHIDKSGSQN